MKRILVVKLWAMGDLLMATPLLRALHEIEGGAQITWVADTTHASILEGHPLLHEVIAVDFSAWRRKLRRGKLRPYLSQSRYLYEEMVKRCFDVALNYHPDKLWTRLLCQAPVRIGLPSKAGFDPNKIFYTQTVHRVLGQRHHTDRYLDGAGAVGVLGPYNRQMVLSPSEQHRTEASAFLEAQPEYRSNLPLILLHPGTSQESKCWPRANFAAVASHLSDYNVVITGSPKETELCQQVVSLCRRTKHAPLPIIAAGKLSHVGVTAALAALASAVVTGDTVMLHIASALQTPVVCIYGSSRPASNIPLFGSNVLLYDASVPCAPCYKEHCPLKGAKHLRCQHAIPPDQVLSALYKLLDEANVADFNLAGRKQIDK